jgi:uncharacterized membrane protein
MSSQVSNNDQQNPPPYPQQYPPQQYPPQQYPPQQYPPQQPVQTTVVVTSNPESNGAYSDPEGGIVAFFAYFFGWLSGIIVLFVERKYRYNIFHSYQSIFFWLAWCVVFVIFDLIDVFAIGFVILTDILYVIMIVMWIVLLYNGYEGAKSGRIYQLPGIIGRLAKEKADEWVPKE